MTNENEGSEDKAGFAPSLTPQLKQALLGSAERFVRLIRLGAPDPILINEFWLMYRKALAGLGPILPARLAQADYWLARTCAGLCARCDDPLDRSEPNFGSGSEPLCTSHRAKQDAQEQKHLGDNDSC